jgi:hypothetical protein
LNSEDTRLQSLQKRTKKLAEALGMTPTRKTHAVVSDGKWWIVGCKEGDQPMPRTSRYMSLRDAVERAEAWLAPELGELDKKEKDNDKDG